MYGGLRVRLRSFEVCGCVEGLQEWWVMNGRLRMDDGGSMGLPKRCGKVLGFWQ